MTIIGLDYGNFYSQPVVIIGMDPKTRRGGEPMNLCDPSSLDANGIPTAFFRSARRNNGMPLVGYEATQARPSANIVRYLKRQMGKTVTLDGVDFKVDDMITATIQHCVREANRQLFARTQQTTNLIGLSYPATFVNDQRMKLIRLAEAATLEDGRHVKVIGTVKEPAAAALDYLASQTDAAKETCVMAYDLGAGTFDLSVVVAFPGGKLHADGKSVYYYDAISTGGIAELGGKEFDQVMFDLIVKEMGLTPTGNQKERLMRMAENYKRGLTTSDCVLVPFEMPDEDVLEAEISLEEFNEAARPLIMKTVDEMKRMLAEPNVRKPDLILLTGGASQMRIVREVLEEQFPQYHGRIIPYCPSKAIAQGAARFAVEEKDEEIVVSRTTLELGTLVSDDEKKQKISLLIPSNTPIPYSSGEHKYSTVNRAQTRMDFSVWEAIKTNPNRKEPETDYQKVIPLTYYFKRSAQDDGVKELCAICELTIDKNNIVRVNVWEPGRKEETLICSDDILYQQWSKG